MILAILQARLSSSRLPGKVLKPILGKPMLLHQIERVQHSKKIDKLVVATSQDSSDNLIERMCLDNDIEVFRGSLNNVLDRFYQCAKKYNPQYVVRLTGDCPLADWEVIDKVIDTCLKGGFDYVATDLSLPDGLDAEIMTYKALTEAHKFASLPSELEHVTQYINKRPEKFKSGVLRFKEDLSDMRLTVDEPEDFILVEEIYQQMYNVCPNFLIDDVLRLLKNNTSLGKINAHFIRNEGLQKSLKEDVESLKNV